MPHVCIIDDDDAVRDSLRALLEAEGHDVSDYSSGEGFLVSSNGHSAECLVIDVNMPGMSGLFLLQLLRERGDDRPAVIITAEPSREISARAVALGAPFFEKPYQEDDFLEALHGLLNSRVRRPDV